MTLANKITVTRIGLIPLFIIFAVYYGDSLERGRPVPIFYYLAVATFLIAAASDGIDGFIARRYAQKSVLGTILDPIADKALLLAGILTLTFTDWGYRFPLWFPILVIARDVVLAVGSLIIQYLNGKILIRPSWLGKLATVFQMLAIIWILLHIQMWSPMIPICVAGFFTLISGIAYVMEGMRQLHDAGSSGSHRH